ncbi:Hypothetical predicted protein [Pelobates cultripes]|uniref:NXPE C-terminal domain-containing protein n=1 Tax=Pelobates cultripes TaxID=61616 RepID=A0AAD1STX5_PELCU|nr:Hypothetical predicted protein [Pelobates cultripes]
MYLRLVTRICNMSKSDTKAFKKILFFSVIFILALSFSFRLSLFQPLKSSIHQVTYSDHNVSHMDVNESSTIYNSDDTDREIYQIYNAINHTIPNVSFTWLNKTTSAKNSKAIILNYRKKYCIGDYLTVRVDMFDFLGNKKTYGGDFLRARIYSQSLGAGASGRIEDFNNGSYLINFTLSWEGNVEISIILLHPSEGVSVLWRTRNMGYQNIIYIGKFLNKTQEIHKECGFSLETQEEQCEYADKIHGEFFYCLKPQNVPCEALISLKCQIRNHSYLTKLEESMFTRHEERARDRVSWVVDRHSPRESTEQSPPMSGGPPPMIGVGPTRCSWGPQGPHLPLMGNSALQVKSKCRIGMSPPVPGGYFLKNVWHSLFCNLSSYEPLSQINECLSGKMIYLMGDSTILQWMRYFPKLMKNGSKGLKFFDLHGSGWEKQLLALDMERQVLIQWKKHGLPFVTLSFFTLKDYATVTNEIDRLAGGPQTIIVIALGQHFRPFPLPLFVRRLLNVRKAIERLFLRSPETKVIIKSENTREIKTDVERFSDFHGYIQYLLVKDVFKGLNIGMIDAWDMTVAFDSNAAHPPEIVIKNQINMFLAYIC